MGDGFHPVYGDVSVIRSWLSELPVLLLSATLTKDMYDKGLTTDKLITQQKRQAIFLKIDDVLEFLFYGFCNILVGLLIQETIGKLNECFIGNTCLFLLQSMQYTLSLPKKSGLVKPSIHISRIDSWVVLFMKHNLSVMTS